MNDTKATLACPSRKSTAANRH